MENKFPDIEKMSFEQALKELEVIVRKLESGQQELETSINEYERGTALKEHCDKKLREATLKVEKIIKHPDKSLKTEPLDL